MLLPRWLAVVMAGLVVAGCTNKTAVAPFRPESVTFVSADVGLVIGLSTCGNVQCLRLAKTPDGGHTWTWVTGGGLPGLLLGDGWPSLCRARRGCRPGHLRGNCAVQH